MLSDKKATARADAYAEEVAALGGKYGIANCVIIYRLIESRTLFSKAIGCGIPEADASAIKMLEISMTAVESHREEINRVAKEAATS